MCRAKAAPDRGQGWVQPPRACRAHRLLGPLPSSVTFQQNSPAEGGGLSERGERPILGRREPPPDLFRVQPGGLEGRALAGRLQQALPAISLVSQVSLGTAVANDLGADLVFAQQVYGYGRPGDALIAISTSGNAGNVLAAWSDADIRSATLYENGLAESSV